MQFKLKFDSVPEKEPLKETEQTQEKEVATQNSLDYLGDLDDLYNNHSKNEDGENETHYSQY